MSIESSKSSEFNRQSSALLARMPAAWLQRIVAFLPGETKDLDRVNRTFNRAVEIQRRKLWATLQTHLFIGRIARESSFLRQEGLTTKQKLKYVARMGLGVNAYRYGAHFNFDSIHSFEYTFRDMTESMLCEKASIVNDQGLIQSLHLEEAGFAQLNPGSQEADERARKVPQRSEEKGTSALAPLPSDADNSLALLETHSIIGRISQASTFTNQPGKTAEEKKNIIAAILKIASLSPSFTPNKLTLADFKKIADEISEEMLFNAALKIKDLGLIRSFSLDLLAQKEIEAYFRMAVCNHLDKAVERLIPYLSSSFLSREIDLKEDRNPNKQPTETSDESYTFYVDLVLLKKLLLRKNFDTSRILETATALRNQELIRLALQNDYGIEANLQPSANGLEWGRGLQKAIMTTINQNDPLSLQQILTHSSPSREMLEFARDGALFISAMQANREALSEPTSYRGRQGDKFYGDAIWGHDYTLSLPPDSEALRSQVPERFRNEIIDFDFKFEGDRTPIIALLNQTIAERFPQVEEMKSDS